jgi:hypothetical protein
LGDEIKCIARIGRPRYTPGMAENDQSTDLPGTARRERVVSLRLDQELFEAASKKTEPYGLAATLRGLLRAYVRGDVSLSRDDLLRELMPAPKRPRKPGRRPSTKTKPRSVG